MYNQKLRPTLSNGQLTGAFVQEEKIGQAGLPYLGMLDSTNFDAKRFGDSQAQDQFSPSANTLPNNSIQYQRYPDKVSQDAYSPYPRDGFLSALNTPITSALMGC